MEIINKYRSCIWPVGIAQQLLLGGITLYWLIFLHIAWNNRGGWGTDLPYNLLGFGVIFSLCTVFWLFSSNKTFQFGTTGKLLFLGAVLMTLPLLWSPSFATVIYAIPRMTGMWGGLLFWLTLRQCHLSSPLRLWGLYCLAGAGIIETVIVLIEMYVQPEWLPVIWQQLMTQYGRSGVGVFQQVNVTASFLAMALAAVLTLIIIRSAILNNLYLERIRQALLMTGSVAISAVLTLVYSRTGWLAGLVVVVSLYCLFACSRYQNEGKRQYLLLALPLLGMVIGLLLMPLNFNQALEAHGDSNYQRLITLFYTFMYATHHPLLGYGAGTYEGAYQHYLIGLPGGNPAHEVMTHPHNELLYQYAEGGFVALVGALIWCVMVMRLWIRSASAQSYSILICMLPVMMHSQLEYPLYYSVPHYLALLMLLCLAEPVTGSSEKQQSAKWNYVKRLIRFLMLLLSLYGAKASFQSYYVWQVLGKFEASALVNPEVITDLDVPWVMRLRYEQDKTLLRLFRFSHKPDITSLRDFTRENATWISVHAWPILYSNQVSVLKYLHDQKETAFWQDQAYRTFPWKKNFKFMSKKTSERASTDE
ncbi:hypothetical protein FH968_22825 [Buttiauxella sp. B2]|uniref:PglL family O-oligosaccharyltransferase n=1 Tax=Buttiauxella sp. B2 TaxID=2587812 RepID=UPI00112362EE|nr:O-antigen ligase family protein [Buttiauxella sp. B2]TNV10782.1 hypothetical protein FH968_22825 [Buttiauxella sp. B2]